MDLNAILSEGIVRGASDVHLKVGMQPTIRIHGILYPLEEAAPISREDMAAILDVLLDEHHRERFRTRMQVDLAYQTTESTRFRVNVFLQRGEPSVAMRAIPARIRSVEELHLPSIVNKLALENRGLILSVQKLLDDGDRRHFRCVVDDRRGCGVGDVLGCL